MARRQVRGGDIGVVDCTHDSRQVQPSRLFCALRGARHDGHDHAHTALAAGAGGLLVQRFLDVSVPQLRVPDVRWAIGPAAAAIHGRSAARLRIVAITGTNGKTTTSYLLFSAFVAAGLPAGLPGTVETRIGGVTFDLGVFTNLTGEHPDYHGTIEQYYYAKSLLFTPECCRQALVCVDDEWGVRPAAQCPVPALTFGRGHPRSPDGCSRGGDAAWRDTASPAVPLPSPHGSHDAA